MEFVSLKQQSFQSGLNIYMQFEINVSNATDHSKKIEVA